MPSQRARHQLASAIGLYVAGVAAMAVVSYGGSKSGALTAN
jgi:hypothetical protein